LLEPFFDAWFDDVFEVDYAVDVIVLAEGEGCSAEAGDFFIGCV
jgi:hypothetical protein